MYINKDYGSVYNLKLLDNEYKTLKMLLNKVIFNPKGVSNQFKLYDQEIEVLNQMRGYLQSIN